MAKKDNKPKFTLESTNRQFVNGPTKKVLPAPANDKSTKVTKEQNKSDKNTTRKKSPAPRVEKHDYESVMPKNMREFGNLAASKYGIGSMKGADRERALKSINDTFGEKEPEKLKRHTVSDEDTFDVEAYENHNRNLGSPYDYLDYDYLTKISKNVTGQERYRIDAARVRNANPTQRAELRKELQGQYDYYAPIYSDSKTMMSRYQSRSAAVSPEAYKVTQARMQESKEGMDWYSALLGEVDSIDADETRVKNSEDADIYFGQKGIKNGGKKEYTPTAQGNTQYDYINKYIRGELSESDVQSGLIFPEYTVMEPIEIQILNSLPEEDREAYLSAKTDVLKKRYSEEQDSKAAEYAKENPISAGLDSVTQGFFWGIPSAVDNVIEGITGDVDTYDMSGRAVRKADTYRSVGSQTMREKYGTAAGVAYDTGLTLLDVGINALAGKGVGAALGKLGAGAKLAGNVASGVASANMAGRAASSTMISIADRGGSDFQIVTGGIASGIAEYLFEKFSLDKLFNTKSAAGIGNIIKSLATQSAVEGSEELFTEAANIVVDAIVMQDRSENSLRRRELMIDGGLSADEAAKQVVQENIVQIAKAGGMGALAGGIMGGGAVAAANITHNRYMTRVGERILENPDARNRVLRIGIENNNAEANRVAGMMADGRRIDSRTAGKMVESVLADSLTKDGGLVNIINTIAAVEGRSASYIGSRESIDTAKAVMHMVQGKATEVDDALLSRSNGAITLLSAIEGNTAALESVKKAAGRELREQNSPSSVSEADTFSTGEKAFEGARYKYAEDIERGASESGIGIDKPVESYPYDAKKVIKDYIVSTNENLLEKVKKFRADKNAKFERINLSDVSKREAADVEKLLGIDVSEYRHAINSTSIIHINNRHGENGEHDSTMANPEDIARVEYVFENYDSVEIAKDDKGNEILSKEFRNSNNAPAKMLVYTKKINGTYYGVVSAAENAYKKMWVVTTYISKNKEGITQELHDELSSLSLTSETNLASLPSDNIVAQESGVVKDGEIYSAGKKVSIAENARVVKNIVLDDESATFKRSNPKGYKVIETMAQDLGMRVKYVKGLTDSDGKVLDGVITSEGIFINTESKNPTRFAATHEFSHRMKQASPEIWQRYQDFVIDKLKIDGRYYKVFELKAAAYGNNNEAYINEEIAADYIGELFGNVNELADFIRESRRNAVTVRDVWYGILDKLGLLDEKKKAQRMWRDAYRAAMKNKDVGFEGSKTKINPTFERAFDNWVTNLKRKSGITLKVGSTSDALKSINVKEQTIYWSTTKINDTLKKHTDIDINTLKFIPDLIENPVLILRERPQYSKHENRGNNRIYLLGDLYNKSGIPIMAFLELEPVDGEIRLDEIYVVSTHSRVNEENESDMSYTQGLIDHSQLMYVDPNKNRTNNWLASTKLKMPFHPTTYGPINKITYTDDFVKNNSMQNDGNYSNRKSISGTRMSDIGGETIPPSAEADTSLYTREAVSAEEESTPKGRIKPGAEPRRDVKVPKSVEKGTKVRQFARTAAEAETLSDKTAEGVLENVEQGRFSYTPISDKSAMNNAYATMDAMGIEWVDKKVSDAIGSHSLDKNTVAMAEVLLQRYSEEGQQEKAQKLIVDFAAESTRLAQSMQAISMLKKLDPNYEVAYIDKIVENLKEDIVERNNKKKFGKKQSADIKVSEELKQKLRDAKTEEEREVIREEIYTEIAEQLPATWIDKWNAWRYFAMLGNVRTHVRNMAGNGFFMPMIGTKNIAAKIVEPIAAKISGGKMERSKTFFVGKEYRQFAAEDALAMRKELQGGGKHNPSDMIRDKQKVFNFKPAEWMRIKVGDALEAEDWLFLKKHYKTALSNYLAANKIDLNSMDEKTLDRARRVAITEAQRNTYRDASAFANAVSKFSKKNAVTALLVEGLLPFKKTPANVLKRGIEYSPAGLVKALTTDLYKVTKGDMTASEYIDRICCSLTGTGVAALGILFRSWGMITGASDDDKEKEFDELTGVQNYSLTIGKHNYTLDWLAPFSLPFFVGVEIQNLVEKGEGINFRNGVEVLSNITEPFFEMSMLQGLTGTVDIIKQTNSAELASQIAWNIGTNYANQGVPTLFGQIARTIDGTQRRSYDDKNVDMPGDLQYFLQGLMKKIPGLSQKLEPYVDVWGRQVDSGNILAGAIWNMLSPGYYSGINESSMEKELKRLFEEVGDEDGMSIFPSAAVKKFKLADGTEKNLTAKEYTKIQTVQGQTAYKLLTDIVSSDEYNELDDYTKGKIVSKVHEVARAGGKSAVAGGKWTADTKWVQEALALVEDGKYAEAERYIVDKGVEQVNESRYEEKKAAYKDDFEYDASKYSEAEIGIIDKVESDWAGYWASIDQGRDYNEKTLRHIAVYDEQLSEEMPIEEYAAVRAYAKKTAARMQGSKTNLDSEELYRYLESTDYSRGVKAALYEAIGNKGWRNKYTGRKIGE